MRVPRVLRAVWQACQFYGAAVGGIGVPGLWPEAAEPGRDGAGPAPGHPERLCPERPLSAAEAALARELADEDGRPRFRRDQYR
ncbi:hypothetical protein OK074_2619 [Actinobacteria bacterium OK074]|nr:hypothetical protein OK074_2619 [Actinobacteria bacterium OK074]